jgi:hypothetical protein
MSAQKPRGAPSLDLIGTDAQPLPHLIKCQHSLFSQSLPTRLQFVVLGDADDHGTMEWFPISGRKAARVQVVSDGLTGMVIE